MGKRPSGQHEWITETDEDSDAVRYIVPLSDEAGHQKLVVAQRVADLLGKQGTNFVVTFGNYQPDPEIKPGWAVIIYHAEAPNPWEELQLEHIRQLLDERPS